MKFGNPVSSVTVSGTVSVDGGTVGVSGNVGLVTGTQLTAPDGTVTQPVQSQIPTSVFGDGGDGAVTLIANTSVVSLKQYSSLTLADGVVVTASFPILCTGTIFTAGTAYISNNGSDGQGGTHSGSGVAIGGAGGLAGTYPAGGTGGNGLNGNGIGLVGGSVTLPANAFWYGSPGGKGGDSFGTSVGGAGGTTPQTGQAPLIDYTLAFGLLGPGAGGGGGGCDGGSDASGAGGGGGGVIVVVTNTISGKVYITANGGNGGDGRTTGTIYAAGGGGGGGGVAVCVAPNTLNGWDTTYIQAKAGLPGKAGTGVPSPGSTSGTTGTPFKPAIVVA